MTNRTRTGLLGVLALMAFGLPGLGCNRVGDEPKMGEAIILVTGTTVAGASAADVTVDVVATINFSVEDRNTSGTSNPVFNSVKFTSFTINWAGGSFLPGAGIPDSTSFPVGSMDNTITIDLISGGAKPPAGFGDIAQFHFVGEDLIGRAVEFDANVPVVITP
jgi:hypothetical protein